MAQATKKRIMDGFLELLEQRPLDKISVVDIADHCGINRNTFYYYYCDVYALIRELMEVISSREKSRSNSPRRISIVVVIMGSPEAKGSTRSMPPKKGRRLSYSANFSGAFALLRSRPLSSLEEFQQGFVFIRRRNVESSARTPFRDGTGL